MFPSDIFAYKNQCRMSVLNDDNLINRIVKFDKEIGLIAVETMQKAVYFEDVRSEKFTRKPVAQKIDLVSLYQIPKFEPKTS